MFQGAYCVEFDVHLSKDKVPIVYHDLTTCLAVAEVNDKRTFTLSAHLRLDFEKSFKLEKPYICAVAF